jgi:hypothetical protein
VSGAGAFAPGARVRASSPTRSLRVVCPPRVAIAQGAAGTPIADVTLRSGSPSLQNIVFWSERSGVRRYIPWEKRVPTESVCAAQEQEGVGNIRGLFTTKMAIFQEKDWYLSHLAEVASCP